VTRVLPAFVVALLAVAPSASAIVDAADGQSCATRGGALPRGGALLRSGGDVLGRDRVVAHPSGFGRVRIEALLFSTPLPVREVLTLPAVHPRERGAEDRIVDGRALARRNFASQRVASHAAGDPDAAA